MCSSRDQLKLQLFTLFEDFSSAQKVFSTSLSHSQFFPLFNFQDTIIKTFCFDVLQFPLNHENYLSLHPHYLSVRLDVGGLKWTRTTDLTLIRRAL